MEMSITEAKHGILTKTVSTGNATEEDEALWSVCVVDAAASEPDRGAELAAMGCVPPASMLHSSCL